MFNILPQFHFHDSVDNKDNKLFSMEHGMLIIRLFIRMSYLFISMFLEVIL